MSAFGSALRILQDSFQLNLHSQPCLRQPLHHKTTNRTAVPYSYSSNIHQPCNTRPRHLTGYMIMKFLDGQMFMGSLGYTTYLSDPRHLVSYANNDPLFQGGKYKKSRKHKKPKKHKKSRKHRKSKH